jgi:glucose/arabinose dehydrogenase
VDFVKVPPHDNGEPAALNFLYHAGDGSGRLFVNDMCGKIFVIRDGRLNDTPFLDLGVVRKPYLRCDELEFGVLTFAFHPNFTRPDAAGFRKFYTIHTENLEGSEPGDTPPLVNPTLKPDHLTIVSEWSIDQNNPDRIDPETRRDVIRFGPWRKDHGGGQLAFDPTLSRRDPEYGLLYISVGDGGNSALGQNGKVDIYQHAQNTALPFGKILRINPLASGAAHYSIPPSNPFVDRPGFLPEIWAYGLRNPERFSWDLGGRHKMLIADIGQANIEEIDVGQAGANYGWSLYEGRFLVDHEDERHLLPVLEPPAGFVFPVAQYDHHDFSRGVAAVIGGFVYRGKLVPNLRGKYVFGDIVSGDIFIADANSLESGTETAISRLRLFYRGAETEMRPGVVGNDQRADLRFGLGEDGEIYVLTKVDGMVRRLLPHDGP